MKKYILIAFICILSFFVCLTAFGPWKWYRIPSGQNDVLGSTVYVSKLPVWFGSYVLQAPTERESDEMYLQELEKQVESYKSWPEENNEAKKLVVKWHEEEIEKVKKRLEEPESP